MEEIFSYGSEILAWVVLIFGIAYAALKKIAPLTTTTKDDAVLEKISSFVDFAKPLLEKVNFDAEAVIKEKKAKKSK